MRGENNMALETKHLIFIKPSGKLIAMMPEDTDISTIDRTKFDIKTLEFDAYAGQYYHGDYQTGDIKSKADKPLVNESTLKYNTNVKILNEYSIHKQLSIIIDMLDKSDIPNTDEFTTMVDFINSAVSNLKEKTKVYKDNPNTYTFVSKDDDAAHAEAVKKFE